MSSPRVSIPPVIYTPSLLALPTPTYWLGDVAGARNLYGADGEGETVGVLGTGLDDQWANTLRDTVLRTYRPDANGHETGVVSLVNAIAPKATIAVYKCLDASGAGNMDDCVAAVRKATADGCTVLNLSWGGSVEYKPLVDALREADKRGILIAAAAGNEGIGSIAYPAASQYTWSVGAHDEAFKRASFSSRSPDCMAGGVNVRMWGLRGGWVVASGTSFATPCVAGAMALWLQAMRRTGQDDRSGSVWKTDVMETGRDMDSPGFDETSGAGAIQFAALIRRVLGRTNKGKPDEPTTPSTLQKITLPKLPAGFEWELPK